MIEAGVVELADTQDLKSRAGPTPRPGYQGGFRCNAQEA
jgi:hypothetical protein